MKVLRPEIAVALGAERFQREIHLAARLQHPHILPVLDSGGSDALLWFTMPHVTGESLRSRLERERQLSVEESIRLASELGDALEYAHNSGVIHRDVKPGNVLLSDNHALLADFGIARSVLDETDRLTESGMILGTPAYMSPEQLAGERHLDHRTDIYALGCLLYEMLAGEPPFTGPTAQAIAAKHLTEPVPAITRVRTAVPRSVERTLERALAKVPADRFGTAAEFSASLRRAATEKPERVARGRSKKRWAAIAAAMLLVGGLYFRQKIGSAPAAGPLTLAVLPFRALGISADSGVLTIGIPDAIITRLAAVQQLRMRPTGAVLGYVGKEVNPREVGRTLAVEYLLMGTVQTTGEDLRVSVQLLDAGDGTLLWGSHYDLPRKNLLPLQDSVAERVSSTLAVRLTADERNRLYRRYTANPAAYEWYLRGRADLARVSEEGTRSALASFQHALELDASYALAQAGLAMASADMHLRFASGSEVAVWGERARTEARRALALDPSLAEAHLAMAAVSRKSDFDWDGTLSESGRALGLNPNLDLAHYFREAAFYHLGLFEQARREDQEAQGLDPANEVERWRSSGVVAFLEGRFPEAVALLEKARKSSSHAFTDSYLGQAYYYLGDTARALATLDSLTRSSSAPATARAQAALASLKAHGGDTAAAERLARQAQQGYIDHHVAYSLGATYAQLHRPALAAKWLSQAVRTGFPCYPWFVRDPLLDPVRHSPEVNAMLLELRKNWEATKARYS
jgi:serine/threonine-protein kinase